MSDGAIDVGAQDPELRNSPIADESDEDTETLRESIPGEDFCYFNGTPYAHGTEVRSGTTYLRCDYGIWVPSGPGDPDNP
ncbi:hypothetical protein [Lentisalinibacter sediminis]|uniref:hypothetical protein n=1 Tax=Lentisalinibacter sediminis TaxID=2992237 RepID=UPI00386901E3